MTVVLGIDAAWTLAQPSGIALVQSRGPKWECVAVAPSYASFMALAQGVPVDWDRKPKGDPPDVDALLKAARRLLDGTKVDVVAVDMPLATRPISGRRRADNLLSSAFGGRGCAVHSPTIERPGPIADLIRKGFAKSGFPLATADFRPGTHPALFEVYPHIAVMKLLDQNYRVPYKIARVAHYWPECSAEERRRKILAIWGRILAALKKSIQGMGLSPKGSNLASLKRWEDGMDAIVCAWIGIEYLRGRTVPFGDETAAIWAPSQT
jgi:predicted RNase H-like nuclease